MVIKRTITAYSFLTIHFWSHYGSWAIHSHGQFYLVRFCLKIVSFSHHGVSISSLYCIDATTAVLFTLILPRKALKVEL